MTSILLPLLPRPLATSPIPGRHPRPLLAMVLAATALAPPADAAPPKPLVGSGAATVPADAAFFFSSLRLREQYDRIVTSNAFAALRDLPAMKRALGSWDEQREMPGSPVSMALTFLELPENAQAVELLADMVATDTFLYGEPSCVAFAELLRKLQRAQQAAQAIPPGGLEIDDIELIEGGDQEAAVGGPRIVPVARQVGLEPTVGAGQAEALLGVLADNLDLVVVPDLVWGFRTAKKEAGEFQVRRIEVLAKMLVEMNPALEGSLARRRIAGGEVLTFTLDGGLLPWDALAADLAAELGGSEALDKVLDRVRGLDLVVALGTVGDWVILSIGDSVDHLDKLVLPGREARALVDTKPFSPLREHAAEKLTTVWYVSEPMAAAVAASAEDLDPMLAALTAAIERNQLMPADAAEESRALLARARDEYAAWLAKPGPWLAYSFMSRQGYEGYAWDWSGNEALEGGARLGLLEHAGGSPAAVAVSRLRANPVRLAAVAGLLADGWSLFARLAAPAMQNGDREKFEAFNEHVVPLGGRLADILTTKFAASLADGQVGLVLDARSVTDKPQRELPGSAEPLPILEPAILLPLKDRDLFRNALSDLFDLADRFVDAVRRVDPNAVPAGYRVPDPEKSKVEGATIWSFAIPNAGLDEQVKPSIAVGEDVAVFTLVPGQAVRMLPARKLDTAAELSGFETPLAAAAAVDFPTLVDAVEPWIVYLTRYGCVQQRERRVDPGRVLTARDETREAAEAIEHVRVVLDVARCLKAAVAETDRRDDATVTHWRNVIRDMPKR